MKLFQLQSIGWDEKLIMNEEKIWM